MSRRRKILLGLGGGLPSTPTFAFSVKSNNAGTTGTSKFVFPLIAANTLNYFVDWGDGSAIENVTDLATAQTAHTFLGGPGTYNVSVTGDISGWQFNNGGDRLKLMNITNWSALSITETATFYGCDNLTISTTESPIIATTNLDFTFRVCPSLVNVNLSSWDVSSVTRFSGFIRDCISLETLNITGWDTGAMVNATNFVKANSALTTITGINDINTSSASNLSTMFNGATMLTGLDLRSWQVSGVSIFGSFMTGNPGMTTAAYDASLIAFDAQGAMSYSGTLDFGGSKYTNSGAALAARTSLVSKWGAIVDGGPA